MTFQQRIIYGLVMAAAVFFVGHIVLAVGSLLINLVFAIAMGAFAVVAVTLALRMSGGGKR